MSRPPRESSRRNRPGPLAALLLGVAWSATAGEARADEPSTDELAAVTAPVHLRHRWAVDLPVTIGLSALAITSVALHDELAPASCRVCDGTAAGASNGLDEAVREALVREDTTPARNVSHVLAFGAAPVFALGFGALAAYADRRKDELLVDVLLVAEATAAAVVVDQGVGLALARERPRFHAAARADVDAVGTVPAEGLGSLPSTHTTMAFALAASSGTVASMRGYRLAPLVWSAGMALGAATAYARIASDDAWLTDTLAGAGIGTAVGVLVPLVLHAPVRGSPISVRAGRTVDVVVAF